MRGQCAKCIMDKSAEEIVFDKNGVCNFCHQAQGALQEIDNEKRNLWNVLNRIKEDGKGKKYDVLIGLSGGVDSSTALHYLVEFGLRPLCYTIDNGWNDPKADENIMRLVEGMKVPFYRHTIDYGKFRELQMAFIRAGVPNIEIPTDHILMATSMDMAVKNGIKWIISGGNVATESIMPASWGYNARDLVHIKDIYKKTTGKKLTGLPTCSLLEWNLYRWVARIKTFYLLDYLDYNRAEAIEMLERKYGYKPYGEKHCESVFTQWHMNYYLFEKFGFDKRKAHLSSLINSGQMTRQEALLEMEKEPIYPELGFEKKVMEYPKRRHEEFAKDNYDLIARIVRKWKS